MGMPASARLQGVVSAVRAIVSSEGWTGLWHRGRTRFFSRARFGRWETDLTRWVPPPPPTGPVEIRRLDPEGLAQVRRSAGTPLHWEFYADLLHGARCCYVGWYDGQIAHISWLLTSADMTRTIHLEPGEVELNYAYTEPAFRGRGLLSAVQSAMLRDAQRSGIRRAYTHVAVDNTTSARAVSKTGFSLAGTLTLTWIIGLCRARFIPVAVADCSRGIGPGNRR